MRGLVLLLLVCVVGCLAQIRPSIPSTFRARVRAFLRSGDAHHKDEWRGGGIYAMDLAKGFKRTHVTLMGDKEPKTIVLHTLDRYDMDFSFEIDARQRCVPHRVQKSLEDPFAWVAKASYTGSFSYLGHDLETWEYTDEHKTLFRVSVIKGTSQPVLFSTHYNPQNASAHELEMEVREWKPEPSPEWMMYIPAACLRPTEENVTDVNGVVYFANNNWDCADVACDQTVPSGSLQPNYACAEFVARCLAYGGYIPGLGATDPQANYVDYSYQGTGYDLTGCVYLSPCLGALGFQQLPAAYSSVNAGVAAFGDGGDGPMSHAVIGVGPQVDDAHNYARQNWPVSGSLYAGIDACWAPSGSGSSSTSSTSSSSYAAAMKEALEFKLGDNIYVGGHGSVYNLKPYKNQKITKPGMEVDPTVESTDFVLSEERASKKFF